MVATLCLDAQDLGEENLGFSWCLTDDFRPGEIVEVRSLSEILKTLDENGTLEGLPFMPEMSKYCGKEFRVSKRVNKLFVEGIGNRRIKNILILEGTTCDGQFHGGCARTCQILWKEAWLRRPSDGSSVGSLSSWRDGGAVGLQKPMCEGLSCQLASLPMATCFYPFSFEDVVRQCFCGLGSEKPGFFGKVCGFLLWLNFKVQQMLGRKKYATLHGVLDRTPTVSLNLRPGELVEVKSREEILATLDRRGRNRGLSFTAEMLKFCGGRYRVLKRVDRMIVEKTGRLREIANTVILEGVTCDGSDHDGCPRNCYCLWREIWLKRV